MLEAKEIKKIKPEDIDDVGRCDTLCHEEFILTRLIPIQEETICRAQGENCCCRLRFPRALLFLELNIRNSFQVIKSLTLGNDRPKT